MQTNQTRLAEITEFPGWERSGDFIKRLVIENNCKIVGDVGGGRMPRVGLDFIKKHGIAYHLFDISASELEQADPAYHKVVMDVACSDAEFEKLNVRRDFDFIYSHMLLEHILDPMQAHKNFYKILKPGGLSVHMFPSRNNFPLFVNGLIPEALSHKILKMVQPERDTAGHEGKFKAYYHHCGMPNRAMHDAFEAMGYEVLQHTSYVGHDYYKRVGPLDAVEKRLRKLIVKAGLPIISANLLILRKPLKNS